MRLDHNAHALSTLASHPLSVVDNLPLRLAGALPNGGLHFGQLLKHLYTSRGLTQADVAAAAEISVGTISRALTKPKYQGHKGTVLRIFHVLDRDTPLTDNEKEVFFQLAGLDAKARNVRPAQQHASRGDAIASGGSFTIGQPAERVLAGAPDHTTAHTFVQKLIDEVGTTRVISALEGMASAWGIDLPPRARLDDRDAGVWVHHSGPMDFGEGLRGEIHSPVPSPAPAKPAHRRKASEG